MHSNSLKVAVCGCLHSPGPAPGVLLINFAKLPQSLEVADPSPLCTVLLIPACCSMVLWPLWMPRGLCFLPLKICWPAPLLPLLQRLQQGACYLPELQWGSRLVLLTEDFIAPHHTVLRLTSWISSEQLVWGLSLWSLTLASEMTFLQAALFMPVLKPPEGSVLWPLTKTAAS